MLNGANGPFIGIDPIIIIIVGGFYLICLIMPPCTLLDQDILHSPSPQTKVDFIIKILNFKFDTY